MKCAVCISSGSSLFTEEHILIGDTRPEVIKLFSYSTENKTSTAHKTEAPIKKFLALSLSDVLFIMLINVKMPTIVGILTFMSRINSVL